MTDAQKNVMGWVVVSAVCVGVGLVLVQVVGTLFGVNLTLLKSPEFWAAIIGAIVGGLITLAIQNKVLRDARQQREEDQKRAQQGLANSLVFKMIRITSSFRYINYHMIEAYKKAEAGAEPWQFVQPIINPTPRIKFTSDELGMLLAQKNDSAFNSVAALDDIHNALITVLEQHASHRQDLMQRLPAPQAVEAKWVAECTPPNRSAPSPYS